MSRTINGVARLAGVIAIVPILLWAVSAMAAKSAAMGPDSVVATVGSQKITTGQLDDKIKVQLYDLRKQALDEMIDDGLVEQAAKKEKLSVDDYLKREVDDKADASVTDASAKQFFDQNKDRIPEFKSASYDQIKDRLLLALRHRAANERRDDLIAGLRKDADIKISLVPPRVAVASSGHPERGGKNAPVTIVEFTDFQCPYCRRAEDVVDQVRTQYGDKVRLVHMDFPLSFHAQAMGAADAARCANEQDKFWQFHDAMFADQSKLAPDDLKATAKKLGLDTNKFDACFAKNTYEPEINADVAQGRKLDVSGTPTFFVDGRPLVGAQPLSAFQDVINQELARAGAKKEASAQ